MLSKFSIGARPMMIVVSNDAGRLAQNARTKPATHPFAEQLKFLSTVTV
jgi:hypothetical protein